MTGSRYLLRDVARPGVRLLVAAALSCLVACAEEPKTYATKQAFTDTRLLETQLQKGVSSASDVKRTLGDPTGGGILYLPRVGPDAIDVMFYQDIAMTDIKGKSGQLDVQMRQQILIVYIRNGVYDGFTWFSNAEKATAWVKDTVRGLQR